MKRSTDRIRTTHTGSLIRPPELLRLGEAAQEDPTKEAAYQNALRNEVAEVVRKQAAVGLDAISDGEFGKSSWAAYVLERVSGFTLDRDRRIPLLWLGSDRERFADFFAEDMPSSGGVPAEVCNGPITYTGQAAMDRDIANFKAALATVSVDEAFLPVAAPASTAYNGVNEYYKSDEEYAFAIADALRYEYRAIVDAGLLLQVDDAVLTHMHEQPGWERWAEIRIDALNHALEGIPPDRVRYHICFGSWHVPHVADAPLSKLIKLVLKVNAGAYAIEAANARHEHEWTLWENTKLPEGKILIPGVITHHTTVVEHPELVAQRIVRLARLVGRENVIGGSDCGFAQSKGVQRVHPSIMWAKLEALVEGAKLATAQLWK